MAADSVFFLRTGEETRPFVQVRLIDRTPRLGGEAVMSGPMDEDPGEDTIDITGDLVDVLREAQEYANAKGYDLRIALDGIEWPEHLGIIGNAS